MSITKEMDIRVVERNIRAGKVDRKEYAAYLESLEDCADLCEETETEMIMHIKDDESEAEAPSAK
ncbi:MAG: hypothetical protein ACPGTU_14765 [Myxococcota bacterium]